MPANVACMSQRRYIYRTPAWAKVIFSAAALVSVLGLVAFQVGKRQELGRLLLENALQPSVLSASRWPLVNAQTLAGVKVLVNASDNWTLVHYWATWCVPCQHELPALDAFAKRFRGNIEVLAVSVDESMPQLKKYLSENTRDGFRVLHDPSGRSASLVGVSMYPETFLLDPKGRIVAHYSGPRSWQDPSVVRYFEELLRSS